MAKPKIQIAASGRARRAFLALALIVAQIAPGLAMAAQSGGDGLLIPICAEGEVRFVTWSEATGLGSEPAPAASETMCGACILCCTGGALAAASLRSSFSAFSGVADRSPPADFLAPLDRGEATAHPPRGPPSGRAIV
ncbi:MAG: DUF2946 family protein [Pseudomonadota bacterium]